ncbi:MAG: hypothetical protein ACOWWM_10695 [Desulfobacterales bacterium]
MVKSTQFWAWFVTILCFACLLVPVVQASPMDELVDRLDDGYQALRPPPNSSVDTDYPIRQIALGTYYTNQSLRLLYEQNQELVDRQQEMTEKYDRIIELNERIVELLSRLLEQSQPPEPPGVGGGQ